RIAVMVITENNPVTIIRTDKLSRPTVTETNTPVLLQTGLEITGITEPPRESWRLNSLRKR
ncbi:hypothetical protein, partial [Klebsiella pneumoniae]|uniref:hypothetical protein n=1 Tax=Klebsiella pneumoniae TaxID=573 RepID=UPI001C701199